MAFVSRRAMAFKAEDYTDVQGTVIWLNVILECFIVVVINIYLSSLSMLNQHNNLCTFFILQIQRCKHLLRLLVHMVYSIWEIS